MDVDMSVAESGKRVYDELEQMLKTTYPKQYVAIDPISTEYFVDKTMGGALAKGKAKYPARSFYATVIGKPIHLPPR